MPGRTPALPRYPPRSPVKFANAEGVGRDTIAAASDWHPAVKTGADQGAVRPKGTRNKKPASARAALADLKSGTELVEAGGIEPPSRDNSNGGLYMHSRFFNLGPGGGKRHSPPAPSRLYLVR